MIAVGVTLKYVGIAAASPNDMEKAASAALNDLGAKWHGDYLPLHFQDSAYTRYGTERRSAKYNKSKLSRFGHQRPLVWTGQLEQSATSSARIAATPRGVEITFSSGSRALNFSGSGKRRVFHYPNMRAELTAVATDEPDRFARFLDSRVVAHLQEIAASRARTSAATPLWSM